MTTSIHDPRVNEFLGLWHENGRRYFESSYSRLDYDSDTYSKFARDRRKYIALDQGTSGVFLVDKQTEEVYTISGYGRPNWRVGTLDELIARYRQANEENRMLSHR
jgi:hypothetical protein